MSSDLGFRSKKVFCGFWLIFYPLDLDPWIRIFLRIRIQEAKILRIQRIRVLSTGRITGMYLAWLIEIEWVDFYRDNLVIRQNWVLKVVSSIFVLYKFVYILHDMFLRWKEYTVTELGNLP